MELNYIFTVLILFFSTATLILYIIIKYDDNPFENLHITMSFDVSGKHKPVYDDYIEEWIIGLPNHENEIINIFDEALQEWDRQCKEYLSGCLLWRKHKNELYQTTRIDILQDNYKMFIFEFIRNQTRYRQENYQKQSYNVENIEFVLELSLKELLKINDELKEINYETTLNRWRTRNQRKLMTKAIKDRIKHRDNYTCQICGKYMPDEVGLHIDHIIPIKEGGKSVDSNLRVLCDKCNLKKGRKIFDDTNL